MEVRWWQAARLREMCRQEGLRQSPRKRQQSSIEAEIAMAASVLVDRGRRGVALTTASPIPIPLVVW